MFVDEADEMAEAGRYNEVRELGDLVGMDGPELSDERIMTMLGGIRKALG